MYNPPPASHPLPPPTPPARHPLTHAIHDITVVGKKLMTDVIVGTFISVTVDFSYGYKHHFQVSSSGHV